MIAASTDRSTTIAGGLRIVRPPRPSRDYAVATLIWHVPPDIVWTSEPMFPSLALEALLRSANGPGQCSAVDRVEQDGVYLSVARTHFSCQLEVRGPRHSIPAAIAELAAVFAVADVSEAAAAAARRIVAEDIDRHARDMAVLARYALIRAFTDDNSPLGAYPEGTRELVEDVNVAAIGRTIRAMAGEFPMTAVCSDQDVAEMCTVSFAAPTPAPAATAGRCLIRHPVPSLVRVRGGSGSSRGCKVAWGFLAEAADLEDLVAAEVLIDALGGSWYSRWQRLLREELALTYGTATETITFRHRGRNYVLGTVALTVAPSAVDEVAVHLTEQSRCLTESGLSDGEWRDSSIRLLRAAALHARSARAHVQWTAHLLEGGIDVEFGAVREQALRMPDPEVLARRSARLLEPAVIAIAEGEDE
jgi:Peptidase M16 inactive domain